jgi:hypothetical protein
VRASSRRYFSDGRSTYITRFRKYELPKQAAIMFGTLGVVGGTFKFIYDKKRQDREREEEERTREEASLPFAERAAVSSMLKPFNVEAIASKLEEKAPPELWVERCGVLEQLEPLRLASSRDGKYVVILGEKGTGKSFVSYKFVQAKPGVVYLLLGRGTKAEDVVEKLLEATGFDIKQHPTSNPLPRLQRLLHIVKKKLAPDGVVPVVLVEIERNADPEIVDTVCRTLKELSAECRGSAILTEALAAMMMSPDPARRMEIWVPDFTEAETREYLAKASKWRRAHDRQVLNDEEVDDIISRLGGRPADLHDVVESSVPAAQFVEDRIAVEGRKITALLKEDARYAAVLHALKDKRNLSDEELSDMLDQPVKKIASVAMAEYHVLSYNPVTGRAQLHSVATVEAVKRWALEEAKKWWFQRK